MTERCNKHETVRDKIVQYVVIYDCRLNIYIYFSSTYEDNKIYSLRCHLHSTSITIFYQVMHIHVHAVFKQTYTNCMCITIGNI